MEDIIIYNDAHNGDVFYSRTLINMISHVYNIKYFFNPRLRLPLFSDLTNITEHYGSTVVQHMPEYSTIKKIDAWIGQKDYKYVNLINYGCSYENHFQLAKDLSNELGIEVSKDPWEYLPTVNYKLLPNYLLVKNKLEILSSQFKKIILVCNGPVESAQSENFDFGPIVNHIAASNSDILFLVTQNIQTNFNNILDTFQITEIMPDLLQISYISTFCSAIIGRASGPHCFTHTKDNLMNENKTFISFSRNINEGIFYEKQKSKHFWSDNYDPQNIIKVIEKNI